MFPCDFLGGAPFLHGKPTDVCPSELCTGRMLSKALVILPSGTYDRQIFRCTPPPRMSQIPITAQHAHTMHVHSILRAQPWPGSPRWPVCGAQAFLGAEGLGVSVPRAGDSDSVTARDTGNGAACSFRVDSGKQRAAFLQPEGPAESVLGPLCVCPSAS